MCTLSRRKSRITFYVSSITPSDGTSDAPRAPAPGDVRVNLRRADAGVAEQFLDDAQARPMLQQMRRKAVPQHVRRDVAGNARTADAALDAQPQRYRCERRAAPGQKNIRVRFRRDQLGPSGFEVTVQRGHGGSPDRHHALFVALADDIDEAGVEVKLFEAEVAQFREAQAGGVAEFEHSLVAQIFGGFGFFRFEQFFNFVVRQRLGQPLPAPWQRQIFRHVRGQKLFRFGKTVKRPQRGDFQINTLAAEAR